MISVGVTSAYAITITLGADPVVVQGDLNVDGDIDVSGLFTNDLDSIFFDDGTKFLRWNDFTTGFQFSGNLIGFGDAGTTEEIGFGGTNEGSYNESFRWDNTNTRFALSNDLAIVGPDSVSDDSLCFDDGTKCITWSESGNQFNFNELASFSDNSGSLIMSIEGTIQPSFLTSFGRATLNSFLNFGTPDLLQINTGVVTASGTYLTIGSTELFGIDDLDTINGGTTGDIIIIKIDTGDEITVTSAGNIRTDGSMILDNNDHAGFIFDGTSWNELYRSNLV